MALYAAMNKRSPVLKENFQIEFLLDHTGLEKDVAEIRVELNTFLRSKLLNNQIQLASGVIKGESKDDKPYTTKDKFRKMAEKNPALNELRKQLDLDIE